MPSPSELADKYLGGAAALRDAVAGMTRDQLTARPVPGRWSTLEVVAHLADFDAILAERIKRIIALDHPKLLAADENLFARELHYHDRDVEEELRLIELTRAQLARVIRRLAPGQLARTGEHSLKGPVTLEQVIVTATNHIPHHLPFIADKRKALAGG